MTSVLKSVALAMAISLSFAALAATGKYRLHVDGLACPFCAYGIEKELTRTKGVNDVNIDIDAGTVTVTMSGDSTLTEADAKRIVKDAGFTLSDFEIIE